MNLSSATNRTDERPWRGLAAWLARHLNEHRRILGERLLERKLERYWSPCSIADGAKTLGKGHEIWVSQGLADQVSAKGELLIPQHVTEASIIEHDGDEI